MEILNYLADLATLKSEILLSFTQLFEERNNPFL